MKKYKLFAPFLALVAGAICMALMLLGGYSFESMLWILLAVILGFYIIGALIQKRIHGFVENNERIAREAEEQEGAVIEKETVDSEETEEGSSIPNAKAQETESESQEQSDGIRMRHRPEDTSEE